MTLRVVPEGLATTSAAVEAIAARLAAVHAAAAPLVSVVLPPAVDPVSVQAALNFSEEGTQHEAAVAAGLEVLVRAAVGVTAAATNYLLGDATAASTYLGVGV